MEAWVRQQLMRLAEPFRQLPYTSSPAKPLCPADPWEVAISRARAEIRGLIERGDLDHDELVEPWVEQWAADLYNASGR
jgi:hypothetical protein